jgi:hypothetical protein
MADSTISGLAIATSVRTTDRIPFVTLSASSTQAVTPQLLHDYYVLGRGGPAANVNNSTTTTSIYSVGIPANVMGTNRTVRTVLTGEYWHGAGTAATLKIRVGLSTTTLYNDVTATIASSANSRPVRIELSLRNLDATNSQCLGGLIQIGTPGATTGEGDLAVASIVDCPIRGTSAVDTTSASTLDVFVWHSAASAQITYRHWFGHTELV